MRNREPGIDLFRCLGLLFVTGLHAFLYNGFYSEIQGGVLMWSATSIRWLFSGCNGMFMLLTGYLKGGKPINRKYFHGLLTVLTGYGLTCLISYPIRFLILGERDSLPVFLPLESHEADNQKIPSFPFHSGISSRYMEHSFHHNTRFQVYQEPPSVLSHYFCKSGYSHESVFVLLLKKQLLLPSV